LNAALGSLTKLIVHPQYCRPPDHSLPPMKYGQQKSNYTNYRAYVGAPLIVAELSLRQQRKAAFDKNFLLEIFHSTGVQ
jgi:hypothetical protein